MVSKKKLVLCYRLLQQVRLWHNLLLNKKKLYLSPYFIGSIGEVSSIPAVSRL